MGRAEGRAGLLVLERAEHVLVEEAVLAARLLRPAHSPVAAVLATPACGSSAAFGAVLPHAGGCVASGAACAQSLARFPGEHMFASRKSRNVRSERAVRARSRHCRRAQRQTGGRPASRALEHRDHVVAPRGAPSRRGRVAVAEPMCGRQHHVLEREQLRRAPRARSRRRRARRRQAARRAAPATSAALSTRPPRAVLTRIAPGLKRSSACASIRWRVSAVSGTCRVTTSELRQQVVELQVLERRALLGLGRRRARPVEQARAEAAAAARRRACRSGRGRRSRSSLPRQLAAEQLPGLPARPVARRAACRSASPRRRAAASISASVSSAVALVSTSGVLVTTTPRSRHASRSTLS